VVAGAVPPSGVVTFLFTDVEGSTRRWEIDAEAMRLAMAGHDDVLRQAIASHGGYLFKHTGDGVCAAFGSPKAAVLAAVEAQLAVGLPVRMGIATGEAEPRDGDYFGTVLNRAARVMAAGHGGQILVADSTVRLLTGIELTDLGPHRLRDVSEPINLFQVGGSGLRSEFPALRTLSRRLGNIRPAASSFVGRETELLTVAAEVSRRRLMTLTGVGGVGKTRLALEVAQRLSDDFPDGVWLLELASVADPAAVPAAVAAVLGVLQQSGVSLAESVAEALAGKSSLLVVDNCEHLRDAAAELIDTILTRSTTVRILATSREGLGVAHEHLWAVPSLDVRAGIDSAAVNLFVDRARTVVAGFEFADVEEAATTVEICRRLDGIPLAIELAASRMPSMTVSEVRDRLDQRFRLLVGSRRGLERHQTLRHTVAWSFDLLDPIEKDLLQRCSVFSGGFDLAGAQSVAADGHTDEFEVLDLLDALVRKSLIVAQRVSGRTRYSMLETIRQFAEDRLVDNGLAGEVRSAHAAYFAGRETELEAIWDSARQRDAYDWFSAELPNLRIAFRWAADEAQLDVAAGIATYAAFLGYVIENLEPIAWTEELIPAAAAANHPRLAILQTLASQCWMLGRNHDAMRWCDGAVATLRVDPVYEMPFGIKGFIGAAYLAGGEPQLAADCYTALLEQGGRDGYLVTVGLILALAAIGEVDAAVSTGRALVDSGIENPYLTSFAMMAYGVALAEGDPAGALEVFRRGLNIAHESGNRATETHLITTISRVTAYYGEPIEALEQLTTAMRHYLQAGNLSNLRGGLAILAGLFERLGHDSAAAQILGFALNPFIRAAIPELGSTIAQLRDRLGAKDFDAQERTGQAMTTAEIVAFVEREIEALRFEVAAQPSQDDH
jgi:predicted ATPase/class 3 adenylate cyclase